MVHTFVMRTCSVTFFAVLVCICSLGRRNGMAAEVLETTMVHNRVTHPQLVSTLRSPHTMHRSRDIGLRVLQSAGNITDRQTENIAAAYLKCYSLLDDATSTTNGIMGQEEFVSFLKEMTDGRLSFGRFADLPALFVMIFYTAACSTGSDCVPGNRPQIEIGDTANPNEEIQFLCQQTLKSTFSTAESVFEYFIRYSTDAIDEGDLATCLSTATVNVLLEDLASCPVLTEVDLTQRKKERRTALLRNAPTYIQSKERQQQRRLQSLGSAGTTDDSMCDYDILVTVDRFTELPCNATIPGARQDAQNERCGLVRSTATVTAPQLFEPYSLLLRIEMISILRGVINSGALVTYFPPGTCPLS